jgi:glycerophosphoryl diester phosphodiesterase
MLKVLLKTVCVPLAFALLISKPCQAQAGNQLEGRAVLPAATFSPGPTSGRQLGSAAINGQTAPFLNKQPVQGFSAILNNHDGTFWVMCDNGYGSMESSADFELRVYRILPDFKTQKGGTGNIQVLSHITLSDPDKHVPWAITNFFRTERILTGADFDIESIQLASDGTLWFGDEFGPFLLHTDATGKLLEAPFPLPDFENPGKQVRSPQNPMHEEASAVRIMNALRAHAEKNGNFKAPVFSPWDPMLDDGNTATFIDNRAVPPPGSGLSPASSELFNVASIKNAGYPVVVYTVDDLPRMLQLLNLGVSGIISDRPDLLYQALQQFNGGAYLLPSGLIDNTKFDAQGHRGGRNLRPENTLPAFELALNRLMTTIETDMGIASDGVPMLSHDPAVESLTCRLANGNPYSVANESFIKDLSAAQIQSQFICDKVFRGPEQVNNLNLSPVSVAFAGSSGLASPYVMPTAQNLFDFVKFYFDYYKTGAGSGAVDAEKRWRNAERVRFNMETKVNPRTDTDPVKGVAFADRTIAPEPFVDAALAVLTKPENATFAGRVDIQSFDFRTLLLVHEKQPSIRTVALFGDFPKFADTSVPGTDDGTNLQPGLGAQAGNTPWLAGLPWPYRVTALSNPFRAERSGGFEGMALTTDGKKLLPLLERPLAGWPQNTRLIHEFDLAAKSYNGNRHFYPMDSRGTNIGDFIMFGPTNGLVIEREGSQGDLNGFKAIFEVTLGAPGANVSKRLAVDLLRINDPHRISEPGQPGDVGIGKDFAFPFTTIEDVLFFDSKTIGVLNDNNFPFSLGRHLGTGNPDDNEFIIIKLDQPLTKK